MDGESLELDLPEQSRLTCPLCRGASLEPLRTPEGTAYVCASRHGVWLPQALLESAAVADTEKRLMLAMAIEDHADAAGTTRVAPCCPVCASALETESIDGASGARCAQHGVWMTPRALRAWIDLIRNAFQVQRDQVSRIPSADNFITRNPFLVRIISGALAAALIAAMLLYAYRIGMAR